MNFAELKQGEKKIQREAEALVFASALIGSFVKRSVGRHCRTGPVKVPAGGKGVSHAEEAVADDRTLDSRSRHDG